MHFYIESLLTRAFKSCNENVFVEFNKDHPNTILKLKSMAILYNFFCSMIKFPALKGSPSNHCACFSFALVSPPPPPPHLSLSHLLWLFQEAIKRSLEDMAQIECAFFGAGSCQGDRRTGGGYSTEDFVAFKLDRPS